MNMKNQRGGALIEFVIVLPILLLILAGIADFGILFYNKQVLTNASREGARAGIVNVKDSDGDKIPVTAAHIQEVVEKYCDERLITFGGNKQPQADAPSVEALNYPSDLTVTVNFTYTFLLSPVLNLFGGSFGPTLDLSGVTVMRME